MTYLNSVQWLVSASVALLLAAPAEASGVPPEALMEATAEARAQVPAVLARETDIDVTLEFQRGLFAYDRVLSTTLRVTEGQDSVINVKFNGEPYAVRFKLRGEALRHEGEKPYWALELTRQDSIGGRPSGRPETSYFVIEQDGRVRLGSKGWYRRQMRNFRLTFFLP